MLIKFEDVLIKKDVTATNNAICCNDINSCKLSNGYSEIKIKCFIFTLWGQSFHNQYLWNDHMCLHLYLYSTSAIW